MSDSPQQHAQEILNEPTTEVDSGRSHQSAPDSGVEGEVQVQERSIEEVHEEHPNVSEEEKAGTSTVPPTDKAEDNTVDVKKKPKVIDTIETENDGGQEGPRESADHAETDNIAEKDARAETVQPSTSNEPVASNISADPSPAVSLTALRPLSPVSRTSTPPLTATSTAPAAKKFSSINVNKKFLSKTGSPSPSGPAGPTKLNPSAGRPISSPIPIAAPSSRLLSTTLTTVTSKPSVSPQPPTSSAASSPWAKTALPPSDSSTSGLQQAGTYKRGTPLVSTAPMGQGQGIPSSKPAWRAVNDGRRGGPGMGMSRDFPTASEVAEGKRAAASSAQAHAEAQAAQAEALMQGLNAFTHLEPNAHRWDDDDDEDDIIDFGDGGAKAAKPAQIAPLQSRSERPTDQPVTKSERFAEDFDRSWPRSAQAPITERLPPADPRKRESDRVLFNASSNRLEPPSSRPAPPPQPTQPTKLMSRPEAVPAERPIPGRAPSRQLPPHLANVSDKGRAPPPHQTAVPDKPQTQESSAGRPAWGGNRDQGRQLPPHLATRPELPPQSAVFDDSQSSRPHNGPPGRRQSFAKPPPSNQPIHSEARPTHAAPPSAPVADIGESQAAEMHTAAEKARLRRQAEEEERRAAADRAKQKAKELEARFGPAPVKPAAEASNAAEPSSVAPAPSYTIAQRPRPQQDVSHTAASSGSSAQPSSGPAGLPARPRPSVGEASRPRDDHWRNKPEQSRPAHGPPAPNQEPNQQVRTDPRNRPNRATAESFFEKPKAPQSAPPAEEEDKPVPVAPVLHLPGMPLAPRYTNHEQTVKKDDQINDMLARIKAAMGDRPEENASAGQPASSTSKPAPPPAPLAPVSEFFDVTEPEVPRSPPPAWRTYTVKLPRDCKNVLELSHSQRLALSRTKPPPKGWLMSYNPPLDLHSNSLSVPELLLSSQDDKSHFHRHQKPIPLVNIPQGSYEPFVKGSRSTSSTYPSRPAEQAQPIPTEERQERPAPQAVPSRAGLADRWRIQEPVGAAAPEPSVTQNTIDLLDTPPQPRKARSPVKPPRSAGPARFDKLAIGTDGDTSSEIDLKSGARFMVSSELEGDSLLDEVNKMSLDTVEETEMGAAANGTSQEKTQSPLVHQAGPSSRTHPSSPNGLPPWSNQREHLKHVWEQTGGPSSEAKPPTATPVGSDSTPASAYSSANPPSSSDAATAQQAHHSQAFSPNSAAFQVRYPAGPSYMNANENLSGMSYSSTPKHGSSGVNGYPANGYASMSQQGLWSAPAFGSSSGAYGYSSKPANSPLDQKAAMAFNTAGGSKDMAQYAYNTIPSPQHYARSPYGAYSPSYSTQQQQQMQQQHHQHQQQRMVQTSNGGYGYAGYTNAPQHGARGTSMSGRFAHSQANGSGEEYGGYNGQEGQYYGSSVGQASQAGHNGYYASGAGGAVDPAAGSGGQGSHQQGGVRRKMW